VTTWHGVAQGRRRARRIGRAAAAAGAALLLAAGAAAAQGAAAPEAAGVVDLPRLTGPIVLDGVPDEPAWQAIPPLPLAQYSPVYRGAPSERTELRVAYDDHHLYVAATLYESDPSRIDAYSLTRDAWNGDDTFGILLDTFLDGETGVRFIATPLGVRIDNSISDAGETISYSWSTFWDLATRVTDQGWSGEMRIPFTSLRFARSGDEVEMGMMVYRWATRNGERMTYPAIPPEFRDTRPASMQRVRLRGIEVGRPVLVTPYALSGLGRESVQGPSGGWEWSTRETVKVGGDVKLAPTPNLNLDLSVNTDFADVEVDQQQVNLTRFPLFFPEKRAFFLEREGLFAFATGAGAEGRLFHSRRIGLVAGEPVPIRGGARLVGRVLGTDVGVLTMQTGAVAGGASENFGVARVRRQVGNATSYVGAMATSRVAGPDAWNLTYGLDATLNPVGEEYLTVKWLQTFAEGEQAPRSGGLDAARVVLDWSRRRVRGFSYSSTLTRSGPGYEPAVGWEPSRDFTRLASAVDQQWFFDRDFPLRRISIGYVADAWVRHGDQRLDLAQAQPFLWWQTHPGATVRLSATRSFEDLHDGFRLSDAAEVPPGEYHATSATLTLSPPGGWRVQPRLTVQEGGFYDGARTRLAGGLLWRASRHLEMEGDYQLNRVRFDERGQRFTAHLLGARARVAWNPRVSGSLFLQYNSTIDRLTSNARFRWNAREGRDLWIVWNEGVNTARDPLLPADPRLPFTHGRTLTLKYGHAMVF
jgi:hypothetical protein